jgi:alpha-mannosidase
MSHEASPHSSQAFIDLSQRNKDFIDPQTLSPEDPKKQVLYLIGNGHLDWVWYWQGDRGTSRAHHTFRSALNIMETNDEFTFTASSPLYYQKIQRQDPGMFREIQGRVKENRWGVVGGGWVEPDMNLPSGESFATQFRLTQRYFSEQLGVTPTVALAADAFGHDGTLPQLLKESGYDFYMHMRPQQNEKDLPLGMYRWMMKGTDTGVDAERIFEEYTTGINTTNDHIRRAAQAIDKRLPALSVWYGVGNHGGGPTRDVLKRIEELKQDKDLPQLVFSTPEEYYALVRPTYDQKQKPEKKQLEVSQPFHTGTREVPIPKKSLKKLTKRMPLNNFMISVLGPAYMLHI